MTVAIEYVKYFGVLQYLLTRGFVVLRPEL